MCLLCLVVYRFVFSLLFIPWIELSFSLSLSVTLIGNSNNNHINCDTNNKEWQKVTFTQCYITSYCTLQSIRWSVTVRKSKPINNVELSAQCSFNIYWNWCFGCVCMIRRGYFCRIAMDRASLGKPGKIQFYWPFEWKGIYLMFHQPFDCCWPTKPNNRIVLSM